MRIILAVLLLATSAFANSKEANGTRILRAHLTEQGPLVSASGDGYRLEICHQFSCVTRTAIQLQASDLTPVRKVFACRAFDHISRSDLQRVRYAVFAMEQIIAEKFPEYATGNFDKDQDALRGRPPGSRDCADTAMNIRTFTSLFEQLGLMPFKAHPEIHFNARLFSLHHFYSSVIDGDTEWVFDNWKKGGISVPDVVDRRFFTQSTFERLFSQKVDLDPQLNQDLQTVFEACLAEQF